MTLQPFERDELRHLRFTAHALAQMAARDVTVEDVAAALTFPEVVEPSTHNGREGIRYVRRGLAFVFARERGRPVLVTVLLRERGQWSDADARRRKH